jgi:hypothetical protein
MSDLRALLDEQMGEPPASTVRVDRIIGRERRRRRARVGGTAVAGLAVVLAGASAVRPDGGDRSAGTRPAAGPTCATVIPRFTAPASPGVPPASPTTAAPVAPELPAGAEGALTAALAAAAAEEPALRRLAPAEVGGRTHPALRFFGGPCDQRSGLTYLAAAEVRTAAGAPAGRLLVYVQLDGDTGCTPTGDGGACTVSRGPGGEVIRSRTFDGDVQGQDIVRVLVTVEKPDGTTLQLVADGPPGGRRAPLDVAALTRLGLAPGLSLP